MTAIKKKDSFEEYLGATEYISSSRLKRAKKSGYHYKHEYQEDTEDLQSGRAIHCASLEPMHFEQRYTFFDRAEMPFPDSTLNKKENKEYKKQQESKAKEKSQELLEEVQYIIAKNINKRLRENYPEIVNILEKGDIEQSYYTKDPETGLYVKARPDSILEEQGFIFDLKSASTAYPKSWDHDCAKYDYPFQSAFHAMVVEWVTGIKIEKVFYVVVEKKNPYDVAVRALPDDAMEIAKSRVRYYLNQVKEWEDQQYFPGYEMYKTFSELPISEVELPLYYFND